MSARREDKPHADKSGQGGSKKRYFLQTSFMNDPLKIRPHCKYCDTRSASVVQNRQARKFKLYFLIYKYLSSCSTLFLTDSNRPLSDNQNASRTTMMTTVIHGCHHRSPATKIKISNQAFQVNDPQAWTSLPVPIQEAKRLCF